MLIGDDGTQYEDETMEFFSERGILHNRKIVSIDLSYSLNYGEKDLSMGLHHSVHKDSWNEMKVSGTDETWVNGEFAKLKDILDNCEPQKEFFNRHSGKVLVFLLGCILVTLGILGHSISLLILGRLKNVTPDDTLRIKFYSILGLPMVLSAFAFGWASKLSDKIEALYPDVELLIGPAYFQKEAIKRRQLLNILSLVIIPTLLAIIWEIIF